MADLPKLARVTSYAKNFTKALQDEFEKRTRRVAELVRQQIRQNLARTGGGKASAPGEFPRLQSGKLYRGVRTRLSSRSPYSFRIDNKEGYGDYLEFGTKGGKIITPVQAKALKFTVFKGARSSTVFTHRVKQGAIKPRSWARRTLVEMRETIRAVYTRGIPELKGKGKTTVRIG